MSTENVQEKLDTSRIRSWRSIVTLIVYVFANVIVIYPFHIPLYIPRPVSNPVLDSLSALRITPPRKDRDLCDCTDPSHGHTLRHAFVRFDFPLNHITGPLIAVLFLLAVSAIGQQELHDGIIGSGAESISPLAIVAVFFTMAYICGSMDASGTRKYLAFKVLQRAGGVGYGLFFYLYFSFMGLGTFMGNDFVILFSTAFLAHMCRISTNIVHPRAWIYTQFAISKISSAVFVPSSPTNLILASTFNIRFIHYTANVLIPVVATGIVLFPFLLYIIFADESLVPYSIKVHELSEETRTEFKKPANPHIPYAGRTAENQNSGIEEINLLRLHAIMNPFTDKPSALFGLAIVAIILVTLLVLNGASPSVSEYPVY